jgi:hypothetical protein
MTESRIGAPTDGEDVQADEHTDSTPPSPKLVVLPDTLDTDYWSTLQVTPMICLSNLSGVVPPRAVRAAVRLPSSSPGIAAGPMAQSEDSYC